MPNLTELKGSARITCLVYGDAGTGKTIFATSFPQPIFVADFDGKINSAAKFYPTEHLKGIDYEDYREKGFKAFEETLKQIETTCKYATFVLDSLTTFSDSLLNYIITTQNFKRDHGMPGMQDYHLSSIILKNIIDRILVLPCNVVVTAHMEAKKDETTGAIVRSILASGDKLPKKLPVWFQEVYASFAEIKDKRASYYLQTQTDYKFACRSQIPGLPAIVPSTYKSLTGGESAITKEK
jgi:hypothetical protein